MKYTELGFLQDKVAVNHACNVLQSVHIKDASVLVFITSVYWLNASTFYPTFRNWKAMACLADTPLEEFNLRPDHISAHGMFLSMECLMSLLCNGFSGPVCAACIINSVTLICTNHTNNNYLFVGQSFSLDEAEYGSPYFSYGIPLTTRNTVVLSIGWTCV